MPASQRVFSRIAAAETRPGLAERFSGGLHRFNRAMLDDLHPISEYVKAARAGGAEVGLEENPYVWARLLRGNTSKANVFLEHGTFGKNFWKMEQG